MLRAVSVGNFFSILNNEVKTSEIFSQALDEIKIDFEFLIMRKYASQMHNKQVLATVLKMLNTLLIRIIKKLVSDILKRNNYYNTKTYYLLQQWKYVNMNSAA